MFTGPYISRGNNLSTADVSNASSLSLGTMSFTLPLLPVKALRCVSNSSRIYLVDFKQYLQAGVENMVYLGQSLSRSSSFLYQYIYEK